MSHLGVCSWSLRPRNVSELVERVRATGLDAVQLALDPLRTGGWSAEDTAGALSAAGITIRSGMMAMRGEDYSSLASIRRTGGIRPDEFWDENRHAAGENARIAERLGLRLVSFHAGFLPERRGTERTKLLARLRELVDRFAERGIAVAFETGQETAETLEQFLDELARPAAGINFDPANMILYGMGDPIEALERLLPRVHQVHVKDALPSDRRGQWGTEVRVGTGAVDWTRFFGVLARAERDVDLMIEREAGEERVADIAAARELVVERRAAADAEPVALVHGPETPPDEPDEAPATGLGVGVIGLGYMGRTHLAAYRAAARAGHANRLVAVADRDVARLSQDETVAGNLDTGAGREMGIGDARPYEDPKDLLADEDVELVSICTPTDTHVPLALAALRAKKHVLLEKPVALKARDVRRLAEAARKARRVCLPAMCMRFWPGWSWLREAVKARTYGPVRSAVFRRLGTRPGWSSDFYANLERSGGALFDLHVHDADFVTWCFGMPRAVVTTGTPEHVTTFYRYARGPAHVVAEGGWDHSPGFPFHMGYTVVFERATADYALGRDPCLQLARDGSVEAIPLDESTGYDGEIRHALDVIAKRAKPIATLREATAVTAMLEAERRSLDSGRLVTLRAR
jgi:predicted dehydrogenase/sugar phosphate isomerase/epimerase